MSTVTPFPTLFCTFLLGLLFLFTNTALAKVNILLLGSSKSLGNTTESLVFSPQAIAQQLQQILNEDSSLSGTSLVKFEDIFKQKSLSVGFGDGGNQVPMLHACHSLLQYYYWPENRTSTLNRLSGQLENKWDYVVLLEDPYIIAKVPGYFALGLDKIVAKVTEGGAQPLILLPWPSKGASLNFWNSLQENTFRVTQGSSALKFSASYVVPAGLAWEALSPTAKDSAQIRTSLHGAYLAASAIYSTLYKRSAAVSKYHYRDQLADQAFQTQNLLTQNPISIHTETGVNPFSPIHNPNRILSFQHTGTSSENGILDGLNWMSTKSKIQLIRGGNLPLSFNYGRANTNFEAPKRYKIDPSQYLVSLGFPMQDHANTGNTTMLYGLDWRVDSQENGTDLGVARKMIEDKEIPHTRAIPVRTLYAQLVEANPNFKAYADSWHMSTQLNISIASYMFTLLTGHCSLDPTPPQANTTEWGNWQAQKIGYETAWTLMHLQSPPPCMVVQPDSMQKVFITSKNPVNLKIYLTTPPRSPVSITLEADSIGSLYITPSKLTFTGNNYNSPQWVKLTPILGNQLQQKVIIKTKTTSQDKTWDQISDHWAYTVNRQGGLVSLNSPTNGVFSMRSQLYPQKISFYTSSLNFYSFSIYSHTGKFITSAKGKGNQSFSLPFLPAGIYVVSIQLPYQKSIVELHTLF